MRFIDSAYLFPKPSACPVCGFTAIGSHDAMGHERIIPGPGCLAVCANCLSALEVVDKDLALRPADLTKLPVDLLMAIAHTQLNLRHRRRLARHAAN